MSRAGLFGNSYSLIILHADMHSLVPFPCLPEQPRPLRVLAVRAHSSPTGALTALTALFSVRQGNRHQLLIFLFVYCKQSSQRFQNILPLWTKIVVFLPFLCLFPVLALFSVIPSAPSPSLGEPGASELCCSWRISCCHQCCFLYFAIPNFFFL